MASLTLVKQTVTTLTAASMYRHLTYGGSSCEATVSTVLIHCRTHDVQCHR